MYANTKPWQEFLGLLNDFMHFKIITIDGPAASGKGTLARRLAQELNFAHLDTGLIYRATALAVLENEGNPDNEDDALKAAREIAVDFKLIDQNNPALKSDAIGSVTSKISAYLTVREALLEFQRNLAQNPGKDSQGNPYLGCVLDGRDTGTVVFPDAAAKIFINADVEIRAQRRFKELQSKGFEVTYGAVLADMQERDTRDANRQTAPMTPAEDALILDTTFLQEVEVLDKVLTEILPKLIEVPA